MVMLISSEEGTYTPTVRNNTIVVLHVDLMQRNVGIEINREQTIFTYGKKRKAIPVRDREGP
jgi:hypothetical protein